MTTLTEPNFEDAPLDWLEGLDWSVTRTSLPCLLTRLIIGQIWMKMWDGESERKGQYP